MECCPWFQDGSAGTCCDLVAALYVLLGCCIAVRSAWAIYLLPELSDVRFAKTAQILMRD